MSDTVNLIIYQEQKLTEALEGLNEPFFCSRDLEWTLETNNNHLSKKVSADLVIFHPDYGLMTLLVSKHSVDAEQDHTLFQALERSHELKKELSKSLGELNKSFQFCGAMIALISHPVGIHSVINGQGRIIGPQDIKQLETALIRTYEAADLSGQNLTETQQKLIIDHLNQLSVYQNYPERTLLRSDVRKLNELSNQQSSVVSQLLTQCQRAIITGGAGTGKTEVALTLARQMAEQDKRTLVLCFSADLAFVLQKRLEAYPQVTAQTIHQYTLDTAQKLEVDLTHIDTDSDQRFIDILSTLVDLHDPDQTCCSFDAVLIDEAQDVNAIWLEDLMQFALCKQTQGQVYLFLDARQDVYRRESLNQVYELLEIKPEHIHELTTNYRNTVKITHAAAAIWNQPAQTSPFNPEGIEVRIFQKTVSKIKKRLRNLIKNLGLSASDIVIIAPHLHSSITAIKEVEGIKVSADQDALNQWFKGEVIPITTAENFKGLEANFVMICDLDVNSPYFQKSHFYVALTRAIHSVELYVRDSHTHGEILKMINNIDQEI